MSTLKQLSGQDATFLYLDTDRASTGGTMIYIYDQSTVPGSTVNDLVVALIGGGLRHYLAHHSELPVDSLVAAMPVNTRDSDSGKTGAENQIAFMAAAIGSHIADPVDRLCYVHEHTSSSKTALAGVGAKDLTDINKHTPAALLAAAGKMISTVGFDSAGTGKRLYNVAISNVPEPTVPLYLQGAKMKFWSVVGPLADGMAAIFAVTSYNGELFICPTACRDIVPDPEFLGECIERSDQDTRARDAKIQISEAGSAIFGLPCSCLKSIQPWRHLVRDEHYRNLRESAFEEWSSAVA